MDSPDQDFPGAWPPGERYSSSSSSMPGPTPTTAPSDPTAGPSDGSRRKKPRTWKPRTCRICLETVDPTFHPPTATELGGIFSPGPSVTYDSEGGRLISPCRCKGSSKYVHEKCLQLWRLSGGAGSTRNFYKCPTCLFSYRLARLEWGQVISSVGERTHGIPGLC
jgi:hypothetical protein